jgi:FMN phosphatase YigB (HAD superfamily)
MKKLIIFDLDGTITTESEFYKKVYSGALNELVKEERGSEGLKVLNQCRNNYDGRGELALFNLNIPIKKWAKKLINAPLDLLNRNDEIVRRIRKAEARKVIYTGSPVKMATRILNRIGFAENDFDFIVGWDEPEFFPLKWSCSPWVFEKIIQGFKIDFSEVWSVGDTWETDLEPAKQIGIKTALIGNDKGSPDVFYPTLSEFLQELK